MTTNAPATPAAATRAAAPPSQGFPPIFYVVAAALLWSTGGLFIKATELSAFELSFGRSLLAALTVAYLTRRDGFGVNAVTAILAVLYAALLLLFVMATKRTTAANAIFLQYTAPVYVLILEPLIYKEKFRRRDACVVAACVAGTALFFVGRLRPEETSGNLLAMLSGLCFAFFMLLIRHPRAGEVNRASSIIYGSLLLTLITPLHSSRAPHKVKWSDSASFSPRSLPDRARLHALHARRRARRALFGRGTRRLRRAGLESRLGLLFIGERPRFGPCLAGRSSSRRSSSTQSSRAGKKRTRTKKSADAEC